MSKKELKKLDCPPEDLEKKRTRCEVYSRVVGYLRPVNQWNEGKQEEFYARKTYAKTTR